MKYFQGGCEWQSIMKMPTWERNFYINKIINAKNDAGNTADNKSKQISKTGNLLFQ